MTKESIIFGIGGLILGAAAGAAGMYLYKNREVNDLTDEINGMMDEINILKHPVLREAIKVTEEMEQQIEVDDPEDEEPESEGVKKYHHYKATGGVSSVQALFEKEGDVTEGQKALKDDPKLINYDDIVGLEEINDEEFLEWQEKDYEPVYLDYDGNQDTLVWGKGTDTETIAESKFGLRRNALIGPCWRWFTDYIPEGEETGAFYIKNDNLKKVFEVVVHYDPEGEVIE